MILIDGRPATQISVHDRGLLYGDGHFTTLAVQDGKPLNWPRHWRRLQRGAARLGIPLPARDSVESWLAQASADIALGVLKCLATRGPGGRGYRPPPTARPTFAMVPAPWPDYPAAWREQGVALRVCRTRLGCNPSLAGIKHLNRLENVLARMEWDDPEISEGLLLDPAGHVVEGTMSNLFWTTARGLHTPALDACGVAGVLRGMVLALARLWRIPAHVGHYALDELSQAQEIFLTNSIIGVWPARSWSGRKCSPGPLARRLQSYLTEHRYIAHVS